MATAEDTTVMTFSVWSFYLPTEQDTTYHICEMLKGFGKFPSELLFETEISQWGYQNDFVLLYYKSEYSETAATHFNDLI